MDKAYLIFDAVILLLLVVFAIRGIGRGLLLSLCGLVAVVLAFVGANFLAGAAAPQVARALEPKFQQVIEQRLNEEIAQRTWEPDPVTGEIIPATADQLPLQDVLDVLDEMGLYQDLIATIDRAVQAGMTEVAASAAATVAAAVAQSVAYTVIFIAAFAVILILWTILSHALDLVTRLPGLNTLNRTGGALFGLLKCCALLFLCAWALRFSGNLIPEDLVAQTHLLQFFYNTNPMTLITGM